MNQTADVVVIGGGAIGLSIAYHLAQRGAGEVLVIEQGACGGGATLKATGGFRLQFGTPINVRLSLLALPFWQAFDDTFGAEARFTQRGYLFLATTPAQVAQLEANAAMQQALGVPTRLVTVEEAVALSPGLNPAGVLAGSYGPWDASLEVAGVVEGLVAGCRRAGVTLLEGVTVTGVTVEGDRARGVATSAGVIAAPVVVNAAGNQAGAVAALAGLDLPVRPERRQAAVTAPTGALAPEAAWTIDLGSGCYARPAPGGGAVIGGGDRGVPAGQTEDDTLDEAGIARMRNLIGERFPRLAGVALERAWVGRRPMSPDEHPLLGPSDIGGFIQACGFSGHGLMHAPAAGHLIAELIVDGAARSLDISALRPDRFTRGETLAETMRF